MTNAIPEERLERYITALRDADIYALIHRREDFTRFAEAVIAVANDETDPVYRSGYQTGRMHADGVHDTNRRAHLLHEMALGARWKSGDVVRWYEAQGLTGLGVRAARHDLAVLRDSGAITEHDEKGVRFYTRNPRKDSE
jgi:DNA-binding transcriptional ArsR family regulator